jgi:2-amino-4-hydroxy-6-hydroxymethyldihydropteridine diphosphokinase
MTLAYIALGSNLGDRRQNLDESLRRLRGIPGIQHVRESGYYETEPVGGPPGQNKYLNAAAEIDTSLGLDELFRVLQQIEVALGRVRSEPNARRTLDLDLLLYGDAIHQGADVIVPHPRMHLRSFVLGPLVAIAPAAVHPVLGCSIAELAARALSTSAATAKPLAGKRALITGSTSGIGLAMARAFTAAGADVIVHGRKRAEEVQEIREQLSQHGTRVEYLRADLKEMDACRCLADEAWRLGNGLDGLVNNAGADVLTGSAADWSFERKLQELWKVDLSATLSLGRGIGQLMKTAGRGVILNMGWDQAETGMEGDSGQLFGAVKGAVMAFTKSLAMTLAPEVRVNCLAPGWIRTAWGETASEAWQERASRESLLGRWGHAEDVADAAVWLASDASAFVTGQVVRINGGAVRG